jgi:hypothetical protein
LGEPGNGKQEGTEVYKAHDFRINGQA